MRALGLLLLVVLEFAFASYLSVGTVHPQVADTTASLVQATSTKKSLNWSGYVAQGGEFTAVSGSWIVPEVVAGDHIAADATWVGIGGVGDHRLLQAGTQAISLEDGYIEYQSWIEALPGNSVPTPLRVAPGDLVSVSIQETSPGTWHIAMHNDSTGSSYETDVAYHSVHTSAEWIEEVPEGSEPIKLSQFGVVPFISAHAVKDGTAVTLAEAHATPISMVGDGGELLAVPSVMNASGTAFRVMRQ